MNAEPPDRRRVLVVAALIEGPGGQVLMSQRRPDQSFPLCWEFPGGKVEAGESPAAALVREIDEELGCTIAVGAIYDVVFHAYETFDLLMLVYRCSLISGEPVPRQVHAVAWVPRAEVPARPLPPADVGLAERLAAERPSG